VGPIQFDSSILGCPFFPIPQTCENTLSLTIWKWNAQIFTILVYSDGRIIHKEAVLMHHMLERPHMHKAMVALSIYHPKPLAVLDFKPNQEEDMVHVENNQLT
jgi:hypothetical protein